MPYIEWSDKFSVNVREIDEQHKKLFAMINSLQEAMVANKGREVQKAVIDEMVEYAILHFDTEEQYMKRFAYPGYTTHHAEHVAFTAKAADLKKRVEAVGFVLSLEILSFLKDWLQNHILVTDKRYSAYFNEKGLR